MSIFRASGEGWSHDVFVGELSQAAELIRSICGGTRVPVVSDEQVLRLHGDRLARVLDFETILIPQGEEAKSWPTLEFLTRQLLDLGVTRDLAIIAFGGGSVGDVAGLAASLYKRGCPIVHLPTTLLAQVDSALGGKTAIDAFGQKNLVGTFHPPALVVCDPAFFDTLDARQLRAGYAEVVKYGLIDSEEFFAWCETKGHELLIGRPDARAKAVDHCLRAKARLIGDDLRDTSGQRALLNLGHSFGHAIESTAGFGAVVHGEAVALGMTLAFAFSAELGLCPNQDAERVRSHLRSVGLPTRLSDVGLTGRGGDLLAPMLQDKKAQASGLVLILARGIGKAFVARQVPREQVAAFLQKAA